MKTTLVPGLGAVICLCSILKADELTCGTSLDNLVPYTDPTAGWSDRHSSIVLSWGKSSEPWKKFTDEPGLLHMESLVGWAGSPITDRLLVWKLAKNGKPLPLVLKARNFRPDKIIETDSAEGLQLTATVAFPAHNALAVEIVIANQTPDEQSIELSFDFPGKGRCPDWKGPLEAGNIVSIEDEPEGSWSTLYVHNEHGRQDLWVRDFVAGMTQGTTLEMVCLADLAPRTLRLAPHGSTRLVVPLGFGRYRGSARQALDAAAAKIANGWTPEEETARWREVFKKAPQLAPKYRGQEKYERLYAHAIATLTSLSIQGDGGYAGTNRVPYVTKQGLAIAFFWDTSFTCTGLREFNPALAKEAILCFTENLGPRGALPGTVADSHRAGEGQAPIMTWSAWSIYQRCNDREWLTRVYPALASHIRFWFKYHASARGLCQYWNAGQIADNDARFDPLQGKQFNQPLAGVESPDVNAFLVMETRCLANMAKELGRTDDALAWQQKSDSLAKLIVETMYFPDDSMFYDVKAGTREKLSGVKNPNMFLPLWAGVPLPRAAIKAIVGKHLLNPKEFFRELPFPSLSYDDPKYDPDGYWRGRIWPHVAYWMIQTLWRQGYEQEAQLAADRLLALLATDPWINENYNSATGRGAGRQDYNWSCATAIELLLERYKEPLP